jgi:ubiquinone/menaquinone biosynthesis C-methylase UbiE/uncharacterized protein YbaR (Trm112 family)
MSLFPLNFLEILACPLCDSKLKSETFSVERGDGILYCKAGHWYPIDRGLPRMLVGKLRGDYSEFIRLYDDLLAKRQLRRNERCLEGGGSRQVQEVFGEKWTSKDTVGIAESSGYSSFMRGWMLEKYGWHNESGLRSAMTDKRMILDAGTGLGREVINLARVAPQSIVVGIEFSKSAENALKNISELRNALIVQGDILRMPFKDESFDFILSEGVLHHTANPKEAFGKCCRVLKKGGEIAFYVYRKKGPAREFTDDYLRRIMQELPNEKKWELADRITRLAKALSDLKTEVDVPVDIPELGIKKGKTQVHRFLYWNFLKCFWNDKLPFDENRLGNFDWFAPEYAHRLTEEEIRAWCEGKGIDIIWFHREESGYSARGLKR